MALAQPAGHRGPKPPKPKECEPWHPQDPGLTMLEESKVPTYTVFGVSALEAVIVILGRYPMVGDLDPLGMGLRAIARRPQTSPGSLSKHWVAVKELKLSYHSMDT